MTPNQNQAIVVIACQVFQGLLERYLPDEIQSHITFLDYGLHSIPKRLTQSLQEVLDSIEEPSTVILGYGLCGNGLHGIKAGKHTLLVPRADDCIAIFFGSQEIYRREFTNNPGTYYLTKGWLESGSNPLDEYQKYTSKYGEEKAAWIMDQQYKNYKRIAFVTHSKDDLELYRPKAMEVAEYCSQWGMRYEEIVGSDELIIRLLEAKDNFDHNVGNEIIIVPPGGELLQSTFIQLE